MTTAFALGLATAGAAIAFSASYMRPRLFWYWVIGSAVVVGGVVIDQISYIDELLVGCVVVGAALRGGARLRRRTRHWPIAPDRGHIILFLATCTYMALEAFRGIAITESPQKFRWVVFFILVGILGLLMSRGSSPFPGRRNAAILLAGTGFMYFLMYAALGWAYESFGFGSRYDIQNVLWGGTSYAAFPLVIVMPASLYLLRDKVKSVRRLAWANIAIIVWQAFYYESRISWLSLIIFFMTGVLVLGTRRAAAFAAIFAGILWLFITFFWPAYYDLATFEQVVYQPVLAPWGRSDEIRFSDFSRLAHTQIGFDVVRSDVSIFFIGTGLRASGPLVSRALVEYYDSSGMGRYAELVAYQTSTVGLSTLLIETGMIGFSLYLANFMMACRSILRAEKGRYRYTLLGALGLAGLWTLVTNPLDIIVFHLMIMPSGLLLMLTSANQEAPLSGSPVRRRMRTG